MSGKNQKRKNWTISLTAALAAAAAAAVVGCMTTGGGEVATDRVYIRSTAGSVLFDHGKHNGAIDACTACHHDLLGAAVKSCETCHEDEEMQAADFDHAELKEIHSRNCAGCHEQIGEEDQIASCRSCHAKTQDAEGRTVSCSSCHEDEEITPELMAHDEYLEIEDHSCLGCHTPSTISEASHTHCTTCHLAEAPKRFALADGSVNCGACHLP